MVSLLSWRKCLSTKRLNGNSMRRTERMNRLRSLLLMMLCLRWSIEKVMAMLTTLCLLLLAISWQAKFFLLSDILVSNILLEPSWVVLKETKSTMLSSSLRIWKLLSTPSSRWSQNQSALKLARNSAMKRRRKSFLHWRMPIRWMVFLITSKRLLAARRRECMSLLLIAMLWAILQIVH